MIDKNLQTLIARTTLNVPFDIFLQQLEADYPQIGKINNFEPLHEGYEDANIKLVSQNGIYIVKIFSVDRTSQNILDYTRVLEEARAIDVPVINLVKGTRGFLSFLKEKNISTPYFITDFFEGENFQNKTPTISDMLNLVVYLAKLNNLNFSVEESYDSWGNKNIVKEYNNNSKKLTQEQNELVAPIIEKIKYLNFSKFSKAVIHGDMQRKHVIKNRAGEYCILDFGCMANDPKIIDLSTYLAWFCLAEDTWEQKEEIMKVVVGEYEKIHKLSEYELDAVPLFIEASYAAYFMKTSILISQGDKDDETVDWFEKSHKMLVLFKEFYYKV